MSHVVTGVIAACLYWICSVALATAQSPQDEDKRSVQEVVVTGSFVTQGGAKDVNFLRGEVDRSRIPHPETFTAEGLLSEHHVLLESGTPCRQTFCLVGESIRADMIARPEVRYLVGLGFGTNLTGKPWQRKPLNLVAIVDKSGSMDGEPLDLVRRSLLEVLGHMRTGDQLSIVLYGDQAHVYLEPTPIEDATRARVRASIEAIESAGSTAMERGLQVGYEVARASGATFAGITRAMLFTDERPNVGNTEALGFMTMAREASRAGIGLTTIGVGVQFGAALATTISSVRGGNLFFLRDTTDVEQIFDDEFDYMVSELAHDLTIDVTPHEGYKVAAVYGVPGELMGWQDQRTVRISIPTVFLSSKAGAIFVALAREPDAAQLPDMPLGHDLLARVQLAYVPIETGAVATDRLDVRGPERVPSEAMRLGHLLIDEFAALHRALTAHYIENDQEEAYRQVAALAMKLRNLKDRKFDNEKKLVYQLEQQLAFASGHAAEAGLARTGMARLWGVWEVRSIEGRTALGLREKLEFTPDNQFRRFEKEGGTHVLAEESEYGANRRQILVDDSGVVYDYEVVGNQLVLADGRHETRVFLQRSRLK